MDRPSTPVSPVPPNYTRSWVTIFFINFLPRAFVLVLFISGTLSGYKEYLFGAVSIVFFPFTFIWYMTVIRWLGAEWLSWQFAVLGLLFAADILANRRIGNGAYKGEKPLSLLEFRRAQQKKKKSDDTYIDDTSDSDSFFYTDDDGGDDGDGDDGGDD